MGKKSKAPSQPTTTADMGQFGSTTTGKFGSTWNPTEWQTGFVNNAQNLMSNAQNALLNPELSERRINDLNRTTNLNFQNQMLNPALSKGLLRGSTAQDIYSVGQQNYANAYQQALDAEEARNNQRLANALGNYTTIYDMAKGVTGLSNAANQFAANYALSQAQANQNANAGLYNLIGQSIGAAAGLGNGLGSAKLLASGLRR